MDESEDTTTSVMSTGGNRALSMECPVRAEGIITRNLELFDGRKMCFLEENEVIVVARKKSDQFGMAGGGKTAGIPLKNSKIG